MLLSLILTFASLDPSLKAQAQTQVTKTADKVGIHVWIANNYAKEFLRRLNDPHWLRLNGPNRKTYEMIDAMLAKMQAESKPLAKVAYTPEPGTTPYTLAEAMAFAKAIRGVPPDQIGDILTKFEAERQTTQKGVK
jgi:UDP-N-acetylmuramoylalanine-D-glutamate ligase